MKFQKNNKMYNLSRKGLLLFVFSLALLPQGHALAQSVKNEETFIVDGEYDLYGRGSIGATLIEISKNAYFYVENTYYNKLSAYEKNSVLADINLLSKNFDNYIYPDTREIFGEEWNPGIDDDNRITVLLTSLDSNVGGYFNPNDEYKRENVVDEQSNEREMIYLNPDFLEDQGTEGFLAHEFQHMISWNQKTRDKGVIDEVWINEGRSELASSVTEENIGIEFKDGTLYKRKVNFLQYYNDSLLDWNSLNYDYSSVAVFTQYMKDRFGADIFGNMVDTRKTGINSVEYALDEAGEDASFQDVFTDWAIANYMNNVYINPNYGYKNDGLKNMRIRPTLLIDQNEDGHMVLKEDIRNWSAGYYKIDLSNREEDTAIDIRFNGDNAGEFSFPYIIEYASGKVKVKFMDINSYQNGEAKLESNEGEIESIILIPNSQQLDDAARENQVSGYSFSVTIDITKPEKEISAERLLIRLEGNDRIYLVENGEKRWIVNSTTFNYLGYDWGDVTTIDTEDFNEYPEGNRLEVAITSSDGSLIRGSDDKVYLIENSQKRWITSPQAFSENNYRWEDIKTVSDDEINSYTEGANISASTVYPDGTLIQGDGPKVYLIKQGQKRWITSPQAFGRHGYFWSSIVRTTNAQIASYSSGANIE
ncbi:MAG: hypothetical protein PHI66_02365 [Candidatus Pacebacteria bacterium]|nr:hypothetical protein [Candidatus Paceibacterota bacterium]